jgi:hypothetical protein
MAVDVSTPIIGYENYLEDGTVTTDGTTAANAYDWLTSDAWTSGAASGYISVDLTTSHECDYYAVAGHTIYTKGGSAKMEYWTGAAWADVPNSSYTPPNNDAFMVCFDSTSATQFRFTVSGLSAACTVAVVSFGRRLEMERGVTAGWTPPTLARKDTLYTSRAHDGAINGRSLVRTGCTGSLDLAHLSEDWVRTDLDVFLEATRTQGWFLQWAPLDRPTEVAYVMTTSTPAPTYEAPGFMSISISYEGVTE